MADITTTFVEIFDTVITGQFSPVFGRNIVNQITGITYGLAGTAIAAGQLVYLGPNNEFFLAYALDSGQAKAVGVSLTSVQWPGMSFAVAVSGDILLGAALSIGEVYVVSGNNPGGIAPYSDITTGWYPGVVGLAVTPNILRLNVVTHGGVHV